jgi:ribonuclease Y
MDPVVVLGLALAFALGAVAGLAYRRAVGAGPLRDAEEEARRVREEAERDAAARLQEAEMEGRERAARQEREVQDQLKKRHRQAEEQRREIEQKARNLERRHELLESRQADLDRRAADLDRRQAEAAEAERRAAEALRQQQERLEQIARLTAEQARAELVNQIRAEARREAASYLRKVQEETREEADATARRLVIESMQRISQAQVIDPMTTIVELPNEEMKGRIIGREGRNIRALETATGIDLLVDDTPKAILLSCFDPVRREIARLSVERLIEDGRIHPARIEEVVEKTRQDFEEQIVQRGESVAFELGITEVHPRLVRLVGRMQHCHSRGHNLLQHTRETVLLAVNLAAQVRGEAEVVRRAALLHEIGAVDDSSPELHPALRSAELAQKFNESEGVVRALRSLHPDEPERTPEGILVQIAHSMSDVRPGARKENLEIFTRRMSDLEAIARSFAGVVGAFAIKAGKELRVLVDAEKVSDADAIWLARDIARRIQEAVNFPGQVRVSVVRETRSVDYAM